MIISAHGVTNKVSSRDSNYIVDMVMWSKFDNSSISIREVIIASILLGFDQKNQCSWGVLLVQVQQFETRTRYGFEILHQCDKRVKSKTKKILEANFYICRSYREKTRETGLNCPPSWIRLNGPYLGSNLFSDKVSHKNKNLCKVSFPNNILFLNYVKLKLWCCFYTTCFWRRMNKPLFRIFSLHQ